MNVSQLRPVRSARVSRLSELPAPKRASDRMYAIAFDLDTDKLRTYYPGNYPENAYAEIRRVLAEHRFEWMQGSVYYGHKDSTPVHCVLAVQDIGKRFSWFRNVVRDIRMLRIEENNDLYPALGAPELPLRIAPAAE